MTSIRKAPHGLFASLASYFCTFTGSIGTIHHFELYEGSEGQRYYKDGVWPFVKKYIGH